MRMSEQTTISNAEIMKDFMQYQISFKKGKRVIFNESVSVHQNINNLTKALSIALGKVNNQQVECIEIPSFDFKAFIPAEDRDNLFFVNDKEAFIKDKSWDCTDIRYARKGHKIHLMNNVYPDWIYLKSNFSLSIHLVFDADGYETAIQNSETYKPKKFDDILVEHRDINLFFKVF